SAIVAAELIVTYPDTPNYRRHMALAQNKAGLLAFGGTNYADAVRRFRIALDNYRKLAEAFPKTAAWKQEVAMQLNNLAWLYATLPAQPFHDPAAATTLIDEAQRLTPRVALMWNTRAAADLSAGR